MQIYSFKIQDFFLHSCISRYASKKLILKQPKVKQNFAISFNPFYTCLFFIIIIIIFKWGKYFSTLNGIQNQVLFRYVE